MFPSFNDAVSYRSATGSRFDDWEGHVIFTPRDPLLLMPWKCLIFLCFSHNYFDCFQTPICLYLGLQDILISELSSLHMNAPYAPYYYCPIWGRLRHIIKVSAFCPNPQTGPCRTQDMISWFINNIIRLQGGQGQTNKQRKVWLVAEPDNFHLIQFFLL